MFDFMSDGEIVQEIARQGLWAIMYVVLFLYVLQDSRNREKVLRKDYEQLRQEGIHRESKLTDFITDMSKQYERLTTGVERLTVDVEEIKDEIRIKTKKQKQDKKENEQDDYDYEKENVQDVYDYKK